MAPPIGPPRAVPTVWSTRVATCSILKELPEGADWPTGLPRCFNYPTQPGVGVNEASAAMHRQMGLGSRDIAEKDIARLRRGHPPKEAQQLGFKLTPVRTSQPVIPPDLPRLDLKDRDHKADAIETDRGIAPLRPECAAHERARPLNDLSARHQG